MLSPISPVLTKELVSLIEEQRVAWNIPGISLGVVRLDGGIETHGLGVMNVDGDAVTAETLFPIGSFTKGFIATAIGILIDDMAKGSKGSDRLTWASKLQDILPDDWAMSDRELGVHATLADILSLSSGVPHHDWMYSASDSSSDVIRRLRALRRNRGLLGSWQYSNVMYMVAAEVLKKYTPEHGHERFVQTRILTPAQLVSTTFSATRARATGQLSYGWDGYSGREIPFWFPPTAKLISGPFGMFSNTTDMACRSPNCAFLTTTSQTPIIPPEVFRTITTARSIALGTPNYPEVSIQGYAMGWFRESYRGHDRVHAYGWLPGVSTWVSVYPNAGFAIVILANRDGFRIFNSAVDNTIADRVLGLDPISWHQRLMAPRPYTHPVPEIKPSLPLASYAGTYREEGYGSTITFCLANNMPGTTSDCASVAADFKKVDAANNVHYKWQLQALWPSVWTKHLRLVSVGDHKFFCEACTLFPEGFGADVSPFLANRIPMAVVFMVEGAKVLGFDLYTGAYKGEAENNPDLQQEPDAHFTRA